MQCPAICKQIIHKQKLDVVMLLVLQNPKILGPKTTFNPKVFFSSFMMPIYFSFWTSVSTLKETLYVKLDEEANQILFFKFYCMKEPILDQLDVSIWVISKLHWNVDECTNI